MLAYYAGRLKTVEVNTTFYRTQPDDVIKSWVDVTPEAFRFAVKAHRRITHNRRMPNLEQAMMTLTAQVEGFGDRLGPVLFQLPPTAPFDAGRIERIAALAAAAPVQRARRGVAPGPDPGRAAGRRAIGGAHCGGCR